MKKEGVIMVYVCNYCHRTHSVKSLAKDADGKFYCSKPGCNRELVELDEVIVPAIITLWKKGYDTVKCCSGHYQGVSFNVPYIIFSENGRQDFSILPEGFMITECKGGNMLEPESDMEIPDMHTILRRNDILLQWAEQR